MSVGVERGFSLSNAFDATLIAYDLLGRPMEKRLKLDKKKKCLGIWSSIGRQY